MKKLFLNLAIFFSFSLYGAQYVSLGGGADYCHRTDSDKGEKIGYKLGGAYGYKFSNGVRTEFELVYSDSHKRTHYTIADNGEETKVHASSHSLSYMANACYDIGGLQTYGVTPYIGAGIGLAQNSYKSKTQKGAAVTTQDHEKDDRFAYQAILGAKYPIADQLEVAGEYKYFCGQYHGKNHSFAVALVRSF